LDAVEQLEMDEFRPDCIVLDIEMPRMNGFEFLAKLPNLPGGKDIPVIMLSSKDSIFDMARGRLAGSDKYLTKPFTKQDLLSAIQTHVKLTTAAPAALPEG